MKIGTDPSVFLRFMPRIKVLVIILIVAVLVVLGLVYKKQVWDLILKKKTSDNKGQLRATKIETKRVDMANLALPQNFPDSFPLPEGAKIIESYNLLETKTNATKVAAIKLSSGQDIEKIKDFYAGKLKPPDYKFAVNSDNDDTNSKKSLVFSDKTGILIINLSKEAENTIIKITKDILVIPTSK